MQCYYSVTNAFQSVFWVKYIVKRIVERLRLKKVVFYVDPYYDGIKSLQL